ncbi:MAG TPA: hypothetical protein DCY27_01845 [Desulfobacterales bacterium]|jgi:hypothetical protein|nr:hypothetical protein [Desulfobacterales bacterium]
MKKLIVLVMVAGLLFTGCATLQNACEHGDVIKAKIRAALQIAQVGYPLAVQLAGKTSNPDVHYQIGLLDSALDLLGQLAYDLLCPGLPELHQAENALEQAQEAKAGLGVK